MIILHICDWYHPIGGAEKLMFDTLDALEAQGHTNVIIYNEHSNQQPTGKRPEYACAGLEYFVYYKPRISFLAKQAAGRVRDIIAKHSPDVCHIHNFQNPFLTELLINTLPCVRSVHDPRLYCFTNWKLLPDNSICRNPIGSACIREGCLSRGPFPRTEFDLNAPYVFRHYEVHKRMPTLIAESKAQIEVLVESGFSPEQIQWLPNFTRIKSRAETEAFVENYYREEDVPIVLFVGRASYEKGAHVLIESCRYILSQCKVVLITAGPMLEELQERASEFEEMVKIIDGLSYDETRKWYARASCIVVPSVWLENFCLVGLEAYANMKPVIGSRIGGIQDWLRDGETGWLVEPNDPKDLARLIDTALGDLTELREMGRNAYERVCEYYNQDLYLSRLLTIYSKTIDKYRSNAI